MVKKSITTVIVLAVVGIFGYVAFVPAKQEFKAPVSEQSPVVQAEVISSSTPEIIVEATSTPAPIVVASSTPRPVVKVVAKPTVKPVVVIENKPLTADEVFKQWKPYVANVQCTMTKNGLTYKDSGTGLLINHGTDGASILMTRHGFQDFTNGIWGVLSDSCNVIFPESGFSFQITSKDMKSNDGEIDVGHIVLPSDNTFIKRSLSSKNSLKSCNGVSNNAEVIVIGFPNDAVTSKASYVSGEVTGVTRGYTGGEYIETNTPTKAGYSGGASIAVAKDCYLGMNTFNPNGDNTKSMLLYSTLNGILKYFSN